jgi:hypothetical protein
MTVDSDAAPSAFAAWRARTIRLPFARRISNENPGEYFEKKLVLCGDVRWLFLQETSDRWSDRKKADRRFNLAAMCRFIQRTQGFFNLFDALGAFAQF